MIAYSTIDKLIKDVTKGCEWRASHKGHRCGWNVKKLFVCTGKRYSGTARTAYLPNTNEGQRILRLLEVAFDHRLVFTGINSFCPFFCIELLYIVCFGTFVLLPLVLWTVLLFFCWSLKLYNFIIINIIINIILHFYLSFSWNFCNYWSRKSSNLERHSSQNKFAWRTYRVMRFCPDFKIYCMHWIFQHLT